MHLTGDQLPEEEDMIDRPKTAKILQPYITSLENGIIPMFMVKWQAQKFRDSLKLTKLKF